MAMADRRVMPGVMALLFLTVVLGALKAEAEDVPLEHALESFSYMGSGCPSGSAVGDISLDGLVLSLKFSEFSASTDTGLVGKRKNCQVSLKIRYPMGYQFGLEMVTLRGFTRLDEGVKALHKVSYYIMGQKGTGSFSKSTVGEYDDNYELSGPPSPIIYGKCNVNRNLNINTEVRIDNSANPQGSGLIDVDTVDYVVLFRLAWKKCAK